MKKILLTITLLGSTLSGMSQQLPNNGFEGDWVKFVPYTGGRYNTQSKGLTPENWTIANVIGAGGPGATIVGEEIAGHNSNKAVKLNNAPNSVARTQIVPGYITLGTPWNTAKGSKALNKDGGTFGGISFKYKPDALQFWYKRSCSGTNTQSSVIAYLWNGTVTQTNVPVETTMSKYDSPKKVNMDDRDIWILRKNVSYEGDAVENNPTKLIAHIESYITNNTEDWVEQTYKFKYDQAYKNETPTKFNIIFAASNYFDKNATKGVSLSIDDVTLVYYKHLSKLTINGKTPANFVGDESANNSDKVTIDATDTEYTDGCVVAEAAGAGAEITKASYNPLTAKYEIVVKAADEATKTYEIQFKDVYNKQVYENSLLVHYYDYFPTTQNTITLLSHKEKEQFGFVLENFEFVESDMGMIYVKDLAKKVNADNSITYSNATPEMVYIEGLMREVPVIVNATVKDNQMTATIKIPLEEGNDEELVTVTYGPQLTINPTQSLETTNSTGITNVVMTRTFKAGWNTYCMPFDYNVTDLGTDVKAQEFVSANDNGLNFAAISDGVLKANNPYLVFFPTETTIGTTEEPIFFATTINSYNPTPITFGAYTFSGNYTAGMSMDGKYGVATIEGVQKLRIGGANATLPAGCAYFTTNNNANGMLIRLDGGNVTGILDVNTGVVVENAAVYNLQGVKVSNNGTANLPAGIYVMGGKKVVVK